MDKVLNNLGLCMRAGALVAGTDFVCEYMRQNKVKLIFLANDASENTKNKIINKANYYNVEVNEVYTSFELSNAIGKENRMVLGVTNENFVKILKR